MTELRDQIQRSLGSTYSLERELGGGGMSRVFVAHDATLGRKVVVKVLSPELAAGLSVERFKREIRVAASLQQANIVPVLVAGESEGLPYFTMPFVEGESLRAWLARTGTPMPISEVFHVLRDIGKALAYAHEHGVVHRDIKPDNVLLSGGTAVVTDFGIAKAIAAARTTPQQHETLTQVGVSLGTPAYMSPEQAAGDEVDHRADIYSLGCLAYELLTGHSPFAGRTPQRQLAAHMAEHPKPVQEIRADVPDRLATLVMKCLEKEARLRPQSAAEFNQELEAAHSSGVSQSPVAVLLQPRVSLGRALAMWVAVAVGVPIVARAAIIAIGLPAWVFLASLVVVGLGLPAILITHFVQSTARRALLATPTLTPGGTPVHSTVATMAVKASPHITWRRATMGGALAVASLVLLTAGYMILRVLGIGPGGSLMAAGKLGEREQLLIADFSSSGDSSLGAVVTEALRTDLAQSPNLRIVQANAIRETLRRMQRAPGARLDDTLAREIATREGIKALLSGSILNIGGTYKLTAKLSAAATGEDLAIFSETAEDQKGIIAAIDRLSKSVRAKVGESLRSVNAAAPLERVTTPSLGALTKYVEGVRSFSTEQDWDKGSRLLLEAVALDTGFAMAYRKLSSEAGNRGLRALSLQYAVKAYTHRERLSDAERYLTEANYWSNGPDPDLQKMREAYDALIAIDSTNTTALNNAGLAANAGRDYARGEQLLRRALAVSKAAHYYDNLLDALIGQRKFDEALTVAEELEKQYPSNPVGSIDRARVLYAKGVYDSSQAVLEALLKRTRNSDGIAGVSYFLSNFANARGQLGRAEQAIDETARIAASQGSPGQVAQARIARANNTRMFRGDRQGAIRQLDEIASKDFAALPVAERPYNDLASAYLLAGRTDRGREIIADFERSSQTVKPRGYARTMHALRGEVALQERRLPEAIREFHAADIEVCASCRALDLARAFDAAGMADSAVFFFDRFLQVPDHLRWADAQFLAYALKRLGELHESRGEREKAIGRYSEFARLWKDADPLLQPQVAEVKQRIARLQATDVKPTQKVGR